MVSGVVFHDVRGFEGRESSHDLDDFSAMAKIILRLSWVGGGIFSERRRPVLMDEIGERRIQ